MNNEEKTERRIDRMVVHLRKHLPQTLTLRNSADVLFDYINTLEEPTITLDFSKVSFMSAVFAHQYLTNKKATKKDINEINRSSDTIQMFEVVARRIENDPI